MRTRSRSRRLVGMFGVLIASVPIGCGETPTHSSPPPPLPLSVTAITPNYGFTSGGLSVSITGTGFQPAATVTIGAAAARVVFYGSTSLGAVTAAHEAGPVDVVVTNPGGETARRPLAFTYQVSTPPTIASVEPRSALTSGGTPISIVGTGFNSATLTVGGVKATYVAIDDTLHATMPAHAPGLVDVTVTNSDGQSATLTGALTYLAIEDFDFNGAWVGEAYYESGNKPFQLTIERDHVVSFTCGTSGVVVLDPAPLLRDGKFAYTGANGLAIDGVIRTPTEVDGALNAPSCEDSLGWYAKKK